MNTLIIIYGASGCGKTTVMHKLSKIDTDHIFDIHDFDERGVPDNADETWRKSETKYWLSYTTTSPKPVVLCGCIVPGEVTNIKSNDLQISYFFLDVSTEIHKERLMKRYSTADAIKESERSIGDTIPQFIEDSINFQNHLRKEAEYMHISAINTDSVTPHEIAQNIFSKIIKL